MRFRRGEGNMRLWRRRRVHVVAVVSLFAGAVGLGLGGAASGATAHCD
jgi:hypothetical protein